MVTLHEARKAIGAAEKKATEIGQPARFSRNTTPYSYRAATVGMMATGTRVPDVRCQATHNPTMGASTTGGRNR